MELSIAKSIRRYRLGDMMSDLKNRYETTCYTCGHEIRVGDWILTARSSRNGRRKKRCEECAIQKKMATKEEFDRARRILLVVAK